MKGNIHARQTMTSLTSYSAPVLVMCITKIIKDSDFVLDSINQSINLFNVNMYEV